MDFSLIALGSYHIFIYQPQGSKELRTRLFKLIKEKLCNFYFGIFEIFPTILDFWISENIPANFYFGNFKIFVTNLNFENYKIFPTSFGFGIFKRFPTNIDLNLKTYVYGQHDFTIT